MDTIKFTKEETLVVAHRGLSGIETENTCAAFTAAGNHSYYGIETDIHPTANGKFVTIHDSDLKRVAGVDINVENSTLSELQNVVLFDKDGRKSRSDLRIGTLEDYISICKKYSKHCVLELKSFFSDEEILKIIEIIKGYNYLNDVTFISFDYGNLLKIRKLLPEQSVQFLFHKFTDDIIKSLIADKIDVDVNFCALTKEIVEFLHEVGLKVNCWTVDNKKDAERLAKWGVDFITTNILE